MGKNSRAKLLKHFVLLSMLKVNLLEQNFSLRTSRQHEEGLPIFQTPTVEQTSSIGFPPLAVVHLETAVTRPPAAVGKLRLDQPAVGVDTPATPMH